MTEVSLEKLVQERQFAGILQTHAAVFFRISNTLLAHGRETWNKKHYFQLINEADALESFLDDYGARYNRTYGFLTELVASLRWFAHSGYSVSHFLGRLDSYGPELWGDAEAGIDDLMDASGAIPSQPFFPAPTYSPAMMEAAAGLAAICIAAEFPLPPSSASIAIRIRASPACCSIKSK